MCRSSTGLLKCPNSLCSLSIEVVRLAREVEDRLGHKKGDILTVKIRSMTRNLKKESCVEK